MRAEAKMVEIPTCGVVKCGAWSIEAGGASKMRPSFLISHFSFPILDSRGSAPSGRLHNGNWGISVRHPIGVWVACLSTDRRARTSRTSIPRSRAGCTRLRTVGLSNCRVSDAYHTKASISVIIPSLFHAPQPRTEEAFLFPPSRI